MTATGSRVHGCSGARVPVLGFFGSTVLRFGVPRFNGSALFAFDSSCPRARPHWWDCSKITKQPRRCGRRSPRQNQQWFDFCLCEVAAIVSIEQMIGRFHERAVCDAQVLREFAWQVPAEAFRNVARRRRGRIVHLVSKIEIALDDRLANQFVHAEFQFVGKLPSIELVE